jgi:hypothetical protein
MSKMSLKPDLATLETELIATFLAGHKMFRPDLPYPESHSDLQGGMRALIKRFEIKPREIPLDWADLFPGAVSR